MATAQEMYDAYVAAELACIESGVQSYSVQLPGGGGRTITNVSLSDIRKGIEYWGAKVARQSRRLFAGIQFKGAL